MEEHNNHRTAGKSVDQKAIRYLSLNPSETKWCVHIAGHL